MANTDQTGRLGINAVEAIFLQMGWVFREQPISDWGIDAQVEVCRNDDPTGKLIALQIKSGKSFFRKRGSNYVFYGKKRHLDYWDNHSLPVVIVIHNPEDGLTLWQRVERRSAKIGKEGAWSIDIPPTNILNAQAAEFLAEGIASDDESIRRFNMSLDAPLIFEISQQEDVFLKIDEWINKSLNFRHTKIFFGDSNKSEADRDLETWMPAPGINEFMGQFFPWLSFSYAEKIEEYSSEVAEHILRVELNEIGKAFLLLEQFYRDGPEDKELPELIYSDDEMDDEEWQEYQFQRALEKDREEENR